MRISVEVRGSFHLRVLFQDPKETADNRYIHDQQNQFCCSEVSERFENLQRDEQRGNDDGEVFRPSLFEEKPNAFGDKHSPQQKGDTAQNAELVIGYQIQARQ